MSDDDRGGPRMVASMAKALGYAEARSWAMGALGGPSPDPEQMLCLAIRQLEASHHLALIDRDGLEAVLIERLRAETATTIRERTRGVQTMRTPWLPSRLPLVLGDGCATRSAQSGDAHRSEARSRRGHARGIDRRTVAGGSKWVAAHPRPGGPERLPRRRLPQSSSQVVVPKDGVEPPTRGFSVRCSTS